MYRRMSGPKATTPSTPLSQSLTDQTASGFLWMLAQTAGSKIFGFGTQIVLARLLAPHDFGLVALAYAAVSFAAVIRNTGIQQILVQRQRHFRRWANPAFWFELTVSLATALTLVVVAPIAGAVFHSHTIIGLVLIIAAAAPLSPWYVVPSAKLMMDMRFRALAAVNIAYNLAAMVVSVVLAWRGFGPYSFVIPLLVAGLVRVVWLWRLTLPPIRWRLQFRRWRFLVADSFYMVTTSFLLSVMLQAGSLALGFYYAKSVVGQFFLAFNLSSQVWQLLSQNLGSVLLPAFAKLQGDGQRQIAALLRASRMLAFLSVPASLLLATVARPVVLVVYGAKWLPAAPILQILAIGAALGVPSTPAYTSLQSQGKFKSIFLFTLIQFLPFMAAVFAGARMGGAVGASAAWLVLQAVLSPAWIRLACAAGWREIARVYLGPFAASGLALAPPLLLAWFWRPLSGHYLVYGVVAIASVALIYPLAAWILCRGEMRQFLGQASQLKARLLGRGERL